MNNDRDMMNQSGRDMPVMPGTEVYDANDDKVGSVLEYNPQANCIVVQKGIIFTKDLYIPMSAIDSRDDNGLYLNLTKDQLKDDRFSSPPDYRAGTTTARDEDILTRGDQYGATATQDRDMDVPVREEELTVDKQRRKVGEAHVHKDIVEEQQELNVPVSQERVTVERVPTDKDLPADQVNATDWQDKDVSIPVVGEDVMVEKRPRVKEEIRIHKEPITETEHVADTVRKERIRVDGVDENGNPIDRNANSTDTDTNP